MFSDPVDVADRVRRGAVAAAAFAAFWSSRSVSFDQLSRARYEPPKATFALAWFVIFSACAVCLARVPLPSSVAWPWGLSWTLSIAWAVAISSRRYTWAATWLVLAAIAATVAAAHTTHRALHAATGLHTGWLLIAALLGTATAVPSVPWNVHRAWFVLAVGSTVSAGAAASGNGWVLAPATFPAVVLVAGSLVEQFWNINDKQTRP